MTEDAIEVLKLMGIPVYKAVSEAEAECVNMLKKGVVDCVGSDDMDCLTFGCKTLVKGIRQKNEKVFEINLDAVLKGMNMTYEQFVDFCILSGCDYLPTIPRVGPATALKYIQEHKTIENVLKELEAHNEDDDKAKYIIPPNYDYQTT